MTSATLTRSEAGSGPRTGRHDRTPHDRVPEARRRPVQDLTVLVVGFPRSRPDGDLWALARMAGRIRVAVAADTMPAVSLAGRERWLFSVDAVDVAHGVGRRVAEQLLVPAAEIEVVGTRALAAVGPRWASSAVLAVARPRGVRARLRAARWRRRVRRWARP